MPHGPTVKENSKVKKRSKHLKDAAWEQTTQQEEY